MRMHAHVLGATAESLGPDAASRTCMTSNEPRLAGGLTAAKARRRRLSHRGSRIGESIAVIELVSRLAGGGSSIHGYCQLRLISSPSTLRRRTTPGGRTYHNGALGTNRVTQGNALKSMRESALDPSVDSLGCARLSVTSCAPFEWWITLPSIRLICCSLRVRVASIALTLSVIVDRGKPALARYLRARGRGPLNGER